jgi:acyl carrier protein
VESIEQTIKDYITKQFMFDKPEVALANDLPLFEQGVIDSLGIFLLVAFLEHQFAIKVEPEDVILENFSTINRIKHLVASRVRS